MVSRFDKQTVQRFLDSCAWGSLATAMLVVFQQHEKNALCKPYAILILFSSIVIINAIRDIHRAIRFRN